MKKTFTILLLLLFCGWVNAQTYSGGSGTLAAPYKIATLADLQYLDGHTGDWGKFFIQTATINASATATWNSGLGWLPIGNTTTKFTGTYDGQGYIIDHLTLNRPSDYNHGFFGYTLVASIKNVNLENISIIGGTMALNTPSIKR